MPITPRMSERPVGFIFRSNAGKESQILVPWPRIPVGSPAHIQPPPGRWSGNQASLAPRPIGFPPSLGSHLIHLEGMCPLGGGGGKQKTWIPPPPQTQLVDMRSPESLGQPSPQNQSTLPKGFWEFIPYPLREFWPLTLGGPPTSFNSVTTEPVFT